MKTVKPLLTLFVVALGLACSAAQASGNTVMVTVNNTTYTLTTQNLPYAGHASLFQAQPWWGNEPLAFAISTQLKYQLGDFLGGTGSSPTPSALLAYGTSGTFVSITYWDGTTVQNCPSGCPLQTTTFFYVTTASGIPTVSQWGLIILSALIGLLALYSIRRRMRGRYA
jgi:IPTL-CTERM motif